MQRYEGPSLSGLCRWGWGPPASEPPTAGQQGLRAAVRAKPRQSLSGAWEPPETMEFFRVNYSENYHMHLRMLERV